MCWKTERVYVKNILKRESKQPNGCFSLRWTQYITASERVDVTPPPLSSLSLKALSLVPLFSPSLIVSALSLSFLSQPSLSPLSQPSLSCLLAPLSSLCSLELSLELS